MQKMVHQSYSLKETRRLRYQIFLGTKTSRGLLQVQQKTTVFTSGKWRKTSIGTTMKLRTTRPSNKILHNVRTQGKTTKAPVSASLQD
ncbi:unnamed protein product [Eruca vesicaria subsp. sativa]|uniref:Uncharacterized protein n=1 Tax=Eruca vesicaria subsp. sativa TaxID=29727 RepID=A0ABC8LUR6_ERUVS|nr:unnamed protein product [Eruca vesicaria subsp. sativa]